MISTRFAITCALALSATAACTDTESATNLNPDGPPMIEQVVLTESIVDMSGSTTDNRVFAFGTLPGLTMAQEHAVTSAAVTNQRFRIVFDELLVGNALEEISCRATVGTDGAWDKVPVGATPDDIAKCSVAQDVLKQSCTGARAVCLCQQDTGCVVGADTIAKGDPVGVLDVNQDGAADQHRFIPSSVSLSCGQVTVPADPTKSYWYPSGDQQPPAMGGIEAIGPAIVYYPQAQMSGAVMPTNTTCQFKFDASVVDKSGNQICAPVGGRTAECSGNLDQCTQTCTPGDVSAFTFKTVPLSFLNSSFADNDVGVDRTQPVLLSSNAVVDAASAMTAITMTEGGANFTGFTVSVTNTSGRSSVTVTPTAAGGFAANTVYTLTITTDMKDSFGVPLVMPITYTFTTGA